MLDATRRIRLTRTENGGDDVDTDVDVDVVSARHRRGVVTSRRERDDGGAVSGADSRCRRWSFERRCGDEDDDGNDDDEDDGDDDDG